MLNGDGTIYGRYGTRSDREHWEDDVSVDGMAAALEGALELHKGYPANREQLAGKQSPKPSYERPELFPSLKEKYTSKINYEGDVVRSCIHCDQIGEAQREVYLSQDKPLPENVLFQYPHPKSIGLILDPKERGSVKRVVPGSIAAKSGLLGGDSIESIGGQPILSMADVQWVLHHTDSSKAELPLVVSRGSQQVELKLKLTDGWRRLDTIEWRASTWMLRRRGLGGLKLESVTEEERKQLGVSQGELALKVKHVGQYAPHDAAKRAGFNVGDILLSFDGKSDLVRETDVIAYSIGKFKKGDWIEIEVMRDGKKVTLKLQVT